MNNQNDIHSLLGELARQLARLDRLGETIAAAYLDAAVCQLLRSAKKGKTGTEME